MLVNNLVIIFPIHPVTIATPLSGVVLMPFLMPSRLEDSLGEGRYGMGQ